MISVVDLASVPSPNIITIDIKRKSNKRIKMLKSVKTVPSLMRISTFNTNRKIYFYKLFKWIIWTLMQSVGVLLMMLMGFWIPYIIGCCNRYLDHFGFIVITSRFYQHTVLLFIMYLMLKPSAIPILFHIDCGKPFCTSSDLCGEIRNVSIILIIITELLTFVNKQSALFQRWIRVKIRENNNGSFYGSKQTKCQLLVLTPLKIIRMKQFRIIDIISLFVEEIFD